MTDPDQRICDQCDGERGTWSGPSCGAACDLCGTCFDWTDCEPCDGTGYVDDECVICEGVIVGGCCVDEAEHEDENEENAA